MYVFAALLLLGSAMGHAHAMGRLEQRGAHDSSVRTSPCWLQLLQGRRRYALIISGLSPKPP
jgi:hypothetical protein